MLGLPEVAPPSRERPKERRTAFSAAARHARYVKELEQHVQRLLQRSEKVCDEAFLFKVMPELARGKWTTEKQHPIYDPAKFIAGAKAFREQFHDEAMGRFDEPLLAPNPRSRVVAETDKWTAHDIVLDVYPQFFAWGVLVLPKDLKPGERRPVVVCQHGRNGVPLDMVNRNTTAYNNAAAVLAECGFITFGMARGRVNRLVATFHHDVGLEWPGLIAPDDRRATRGTEPARLCNDSPVLIPGSLHGGALRVTAHGDRVERLRRVFHTVQVIDLRPVMTALFGSVPC